MSKKELSRRDFMKGVAAGAVGLAGFGLLSACGNESDPPSPTPNGESKGRYTPGTYTASAEGYHGTVTVTMTFDESSITAVTVDASGETENVGGAAAEALAQQILDTQSNAIDGVTGASITSEAVRTAAADCITQAGGAAATPIINTVEQITVSPNTDWLGAAPEIAESDIVETLETELLVVGAGNAGLMTAARAAEGGVQTLVIEKALSAMNERHWIGVVDSTAAKEAGVEIDKNRLATELCRYASHRCDERLIRLWLEHSGEMMDWYGDVVKRYHPDVEVHAEWDIGAEGAATGYYVPATMHNFQDNIPEHDYSEATSAYGFSGLSSFLTEHGGSIRFETALIKLEQNESGRVTGAIAKDGNGYIRIRASKGVALCCGGYSADKTMLATLNPDAYISTVSGGGSALNVGDGIRAAMWLGADKDPDPTAMLFDRGTIAPDQLSDGNWDKSGHFHLGSQPWLKVNLRGERFCNESLPYDFILHAAYMEPNHLYNSIYDSTWMEQIAQFQQIGCARVIPSKSGGKLQIFSPEIEAGLLMAMEQAGFIQRADTLEELAEKLNLPVDTFVATVERYNALCEKGVDEDFGKESYRMLPLKTAPFFGCRQGGTILCTLDGLRINTKMQVLNTEGEPIEGLFAAGDCSGGFFAHNYPEYVVGVAVGRTLTEGYLLGGALAEA